jgi:hypothetical protein
MGGPFQYELLIEIDAPENIAHIGFIDVEELRKTTPTPLRWRGKTGWWRRVAKLSRHRQRTIRRPLSPRVAGWQNLTSGASEKPHRNVPPWHSPKASVPSLTCSAAPSINAAATSSGPTRGIAPSRTRWRCGATATSTRSPCAITPKARWRAVATRSRCS